VVKIVASGVAKALAPVMETAATLLGLDPKG
jgi:hypothetical protein